MDASAKMSLFQDLFYVSAALAALGLGLAIFFYFFFDIRYIYMFMSGKDKQESVEQMTKRSAHNGRLRRMNKHTVGAAPTQTPPVCAAPPMQEELQMTVPLAQTQGAQTGYSQPAAVEETSILADEAPTDRMTQPGSGTAGMTQILSDQPDEPIPVASNFILTENTIVLHTDEII